MPSLSARPAFTQTPRLIRGFSPYLRREPTAIRRGTCVQAALPLLTEPSSPEALGSPAGYVVPPDHRLLWPHPSLSTPPTNLCIIQRVLARTVWSGPEREGPQFNLPVCSLRAVFRTPADRTTALGCCFIARAGLRHLRRGSASAISRMAGSWRGSLTRLQSSLDATARVC